MNRMAKFACSKIWIYLSGHVFLADSEEYMYGELIPQNNSFWHEKCENPEESWQIVSQKSGEDWSTKTDHKNIVTITVCNKMQDHRHKRT